MIHLAGLTRGAPCVIASESPHRRIASRRGVMLAGETVVGLPRSNLVKPKSTPASTPPPASGVRALEIAPTVPQMEPFGPVPVSASVDVEVDPFEVTATDAQLDAHAPSTHDLLERAARLGPPRPTFESIVLPNDPVLAEKMQPHAAERRARFRKIVKATVGACVALCVAALVASALSGGEASAATPSESSTMARTAPATRVVTIEKLDDARRGKAVQSHVAAATANARAKTPKRR